LKTNKINTIKRYLISDIEYKIKKELSRECCECKTNFTLELGEIKFYNNKGFDYPHRCKSSIELSRYEIAKGGK